MDKIKFLMTDTGAQTTQLCRQALEAKGIDVTVCEKNGSQALKSLLEEHPPSACALVSLEPAAAPATT